MHAEIIKLVDIALNDGVLTDKEREILLRKANSLGLDLDEFEMYLENRLGKLNKVQQKDQEIVDRSESLNRVFEIEKRQKERKLEENKIVQKENEELKQILEIRVLGSLELRQWWNSLIKEEQKDLRQAINASTNLIGRFNPSEEQLAEMYVVETTENNQREYDKRRKQIEDDRKRRNYDEKELFEIERVEINKLRSSLTKIELKKLDEKNSIFNKIKSLFK